MLSCSPQLCSSLLKDRGYVIFFFFPFCLFVGSGAWYARPTQGSVYYTHTWKKLYFGQMGPEKYSTYLEMLSK